jgi:hypothetical protein
MFLLQPNRFALQELHAKVGDGELLLEFEYPDDRPPDITSEAWKLVAQLRQNLGNALGDIANHNIALVGKARNAVDGRRNRVHQHRAYIAAQGIPVARKALGHAVIERCDRPLRLRAMAEASEPSPKAFITWAHRDPGWEDSDEAAWTEEVYSFALLLRGYGIDVDIDLFHQSEPGIDWTRFGPLRIRDTDWVIVVLSIAWRDRWEGRNAPTVGAGAVAEADVLRSIFGDDQGEFRRKVVLVTLPSRQSEDLVPDGLDGVHRFTLRDLSPEEVMPLIRLLAGKPAFPAGPLGSLPELLPVQPIAPGAARDESTANAPIGSLSESAPERIREIDEQIGAVKRALAGTREPQPGDGPHLPWWRAWHRLRNELAALEEGRSHVESGQTAEQPRAGPGTSGGVRDEAAAASDLVNLRNAAQELRIDIEAKRRRIHAAAVDDRTYWREKFSLDLFDKYGRLVMEERPMVWEPVAFAYLWFDELNDQVPLGTPVAEDKVESLKQGIGQLEHASETLRDLVVELAQDTASPGLAARSAAPALEFVSIEHRDQIRELLNRCSGIMGTGQPVN